MMKLHLTLLLLFTAPLVSADFTDSGFVRIGNDLTVEENTRVEHAVCIGGDIMVFGYVEEEVVAIGGSIYLGPKAVVNSDVVSIGGNIEKHKGAIVQGDIVELSTLDIHQLIPMISGGHHWNFWWFGKFIFGLGYLALCMVVFLIFPGTVNEVTRVIENAPLPSLLAAIISFISVIPLIVILAISLIGIPMIPVVGMSIMVGSLFGYTAAGEFIGGRLSGSIHRPDTSKFGRVLSGLIILWILGLIPFIGNLIQILANVIGFGACVMAIVYRRRGGNPEFL